MPTDNLNGYVSNYLRPVVKIISYRNSLLAEIHIEAQQNNLYISIHTVLHVFMIQLL